MEDQESLLRLSKIKFIAGSAPGAPTLEVLPSTVVVFVGPNNSGKSLSLREIENSCFGKETVRKVINGIDIDFPTDPKQAEELLLKFKIPPPSGQAEAPGQFLIGMHTFRQDEPVRSLNVNIEALRQAVISRDQRNLRPYLSACYTVRLDGRTRFSLMDPKSTGDLLSYPQNHIWALFVDDENREKVRQIVYDAFGAHFVIDPTAMTQFRVRLSSKAPSTKAEEQSLDQSARKFHSQAPLISEFSDGVQAFCGLISAILSLPHKIILIDEPDAFLHPVLARRLGYNLAKISNERNASLIVATHSSEFLIGCLQAVNDVSVVRLTYDGKIATAKSLSSKDLTNMMRDPLLRSTGVLQALFQRAIVATESDTDRVFYDEMNRRLLPEDRGIRDVIFLNAQNMQTIHRIVGPLRRIGLPAAAIVDLDVLRVDYTNWNNLLDSCQVDTKLRTYLDDERAYMVKIFGSLTSDKEKDPVKNSGINLLHGDDRKRSEGLLKNLADHGLFAVPVGELESWLRSVGVSGHGPEWLTSLFSVIGESPIDKEHLKAGKDDVWEFLDSIAKWISDPKRLGTL